MKIFQRFIRIICFILMVLCVLPQNTLAQTAAEEAAEQREFEHERRLEELEDMRSFQEKPKTAEDVLKMIKERAELKIKERKRKALLKTRISAGVNYAHEENPASSVKGSEDKDFTVEENFSFNWVPTFSPTLSGNAGYSLVDLNYLGQENLSTFDHSVNADITYRTLKGKLSLTPGIKHQWLIYPFDVGSRYNQSKAFLKFTHYFAQKWHYGGKYEYAYKFYPKKAARDEVATNLDFSTTHTRHTAEFWVKRFFGKYNVRLKAKSFRNKSNDEYQDFNDYDSHKGEFTLSGAFLENNKLYVSLTSDFEVKHYFDRLAVNTARWDNVWTERLSINYTLKDNMTANYTFTHKISDSNADTGKFVNTTNKVGMTLNF